MSLQVEKLENNTAKLTIEVPAEEFDKAIQAAYQKNKNKFNVPGFRKGKVPYAMVEKMYGAGVFYEEAANELIPDAYANAAAESELEIVARPEINVTQIEKGKSFNNKNITLIICVTVFNFPKYFAAITTCLLAATKRMASTIVSLEIIIIGIMIEIVPSLASRRKIVLINSLSAIGSANLPKVVINLDFLAICPSK